MWIRIVRDLTHYKIGYPKFRKKWEKNYGMKAEGRVNKKLKSIWHYIVNDDQDTAWKFYRQLCKVLKEKYNYD